MNFKNNYIYNQIKHTNKFYNYQFISYQLVFDLLWYGFSEEAYFQRNTFFDKMFINPKSCPYDNLFLIWLFKILKLDEMKIFKTTFIDVDSEVDNLSSSDLNKNLLYYHVINSTNFKSIAEKARNSISHGTFNLTNRFFMIGQKSSKRNGRDVINFYFQCNHLDLNNIFFKLNKLFNISSINEFCNLVLDELDEISKKEDAFYLDGKKLILIHDFKFVKKDVKNNQSDQLIEYLKQHNLFNAIILLFDNSNSSFTENYFKENNLYIVPNNKMINFFNLNINKYVK